MLSSILSWDKLSEHVGLSEYEARVYLSLVTSGASEARKLSMVCGVPRTKIYGTLKKLIERGLVVEMPGEPKKFSPVSPAKAFKTYLQSFREKTSDKVISLVESDRLISLLEEAYQKANVELKQEKGEVWIIHRRSEILRIIREMLSRARTSVDVITTANGLVLFYKAASKLLDKLVEEGVTVQIGAQIGSFNGTLARELNYVCQVKRVDVSLPILFLCVDGREILLAELRPDDFGTHYGEDVGFFSRKPTLCALVSPLLLSPAR